MARQRRPQIFAKDVQGLKYFSILAPFLDRFHDAGTDGDRAGNRRFFFDHYGSRPLFPF